MVTDFLNLLQFYIALVVLNLAVLPLTVKLFSGFKDKGALFGKSLGIYICGYAMWLFSSFHVFEFTSTSCFVIVIAVAFIMYGCVFLKQRKGDNSFGKAIRESWRDMLMGEIAFLLMFIFFSWLFAHRVPSFDTERMMDYGFMVSLSKTDYMPPLDMWAAGCDINYYYFGQYIYTFLHKISFVSVGYAYSFGMTTILAFVAVSVYRLTQNICKSRVGAVISSGIVTFGGSFHYLVFKYLVPMVWDILQLEGEKPGYWFADSTRYIGYVPEVTTDRTIHEMPSYSFLIGDLHAHVANLLVVICILALLWSWLSNEEYDKKEGLFKTVFRREFIVIGFLIAICSMSNYWDFPIYYIVSGSVILFGLLKRFGIKSRAWFDVVFVGIFIMAETILFALPFNLKFEKMIQGISTVTTHSRLHQLVILWAYPVIMVLLYIVMIVRKKAANKRALFIILLGLCSIGLVLIPEFIFVKDIYIQSFPRANTMFKLTFEAYVMFGISVGCIIAEFFGLYFASEDAFEKNRYLRKAIGGTICAVVVICYFPVAAKMWYKDIGEFKYVSMEAEYNILDRNKDEMDAIDALMSLIENGDNKQPVVVTADGNSYTDDCSISVLTGCPTILGWHTHEWLWHNSRDFITQREDELNTIYTGINPEETKILLDKYGVDYVYVGLQEYEKYEEIDTGVLEFLGDIVYCETCPTGQLIEIIKINHE